MWSWRPTNAFHSVANIYIESTGFICDVTQYEFAVRVVGHRIRFCSSSLWTSSVISTLRTAAQSSKRGIVVAWAAVNLAFPSPNVTWTSPVLLTILIGMILRCLPFRRHRRIYAFPCERNIFTPLYRKSGETWYLLELEENDTQYSFHSASCFASRG